MVEPFPGATQSLPRTISSFCLSHLAYKLMPNQISPGPMSRSKLAPYTKSRTFFAATKALFLPPCWGLRSILAYTSSPSLVLAVVFMSSSNTYLSSVVRESPLALIFTMLHSQARGQYGARNSSRISCGHFR